GLHPTIVDASKNCQLIGSNLDHLTEVPSVMAILNIHNVALAIEVVDAVQRLKDVTMGSRSMAGNNVGNHAKAFDSKY
ncbi:hypothetical protein HDU76_006311, partial [Blyttiomyces sp. JEL0837]